jgi:hypothetical protein
MFIMEIVKETTFWDCGYNVSNHTYLLDNKGKVIAYADESTDKIIQLKNGFVLNKRYRKFIKVDHVGLSKLSTVNLDSETKPVPSESVRIFKVKSKNREYLVEYNTVGKYLICPCIGYSYRRKCKHVDAVSKKLEI